MDLIGELLRYLSKFVGFWLSFERYFGGVICENLRDCTRSVKVRVFKRVCDFFDISSKKLAMVAKLDFKSVCKIIV